MTMTFNSTTGSTQFSHESVPSMNFKEGTAYAIEQTLTYGATINWNANLGQVAKVTLTSASATLAAPTNLVSGAFYNLQINQDGAGSRTVVWNSIFHFTNNAAPVLSTGPSLKDFFTFKYDGTYLCEQGRSQGVP